jgi:hypothetical protein
LNLNLNSSALTALLLTVLAGSSRSVHAPECVPSPEPVEANQQ